MAPHQLPGSGNSQAVYLSSSRLGSRHRVVFQPYTREQLIQIVAARVEGLDVFSPNAITFAAAKVCSIPLVREGVGPPPLGRLHPV